jgi:hypothetical protein
MPDVIPLDKLISRLRTDLKLTQTSWVAKNVGTVTSQATLNKNKRKASMLWYLERLKELDPSL